MDTESTDLAIELANGTEREVATKEQLLALRQYKLTLTYYAFR
ncbi:MAG: hypothetical protein ACK4HB_06415 [Candidatus Bipolaricaulia bacterium]